MDPLKTQAFYIVVKVVQNSKIVRFLIYHIHILSCLPDINGPFAAERSRGTKSPYWRANDMLSKVNKFEFSLFKDGAYYCYCAYVLRISRYSDFLSPMLTNAGIFLRGLKLSGESRS